MPSISKLMNAEISRLARREARSLIAGIKKDTIRLKKYTAALKRKVAELEKANKQIINQSRPITPDISPESAPKCLTSRNILAMRKRLKLSQALFAKLVGVTDQSVYNWEAKKGKLKLRGETLSKVIAVRGMKAREAKIELARMDAVKARVGRRAKLGKKGRKH